MDLEKILEHIVKGDYKAVAAVLIVVLVQALKTKGAKAFPILANGYVAFICSVLLGAALFALCALSPQIPLTVSLVVAGAEAGGLASGGWSGFKAIGEKMKASKAEKTATPPPTPPEA